MKTDLFQSCGHCWVFHMLLYWQIPIHLLKASCTLLFKCRPHTPNDPQRSGGRALISPRTPVPALLPFTLHGYPWTPAGQTTSQTHWWNSSVNYVRLKPPNWIQRHPHLNWKLPVGIGNPLRTRHHLEARLSFLLDRKKQHNSPKPLWPALRDPKTLQSSGSKRNGWKIRY